MLISNIILTTDIDETYKILKTEIKEHKHDRSEITLDKTRDKLIITITAKDSVALRASFNSIATVLTIYEKTKNLTSKLKN